VTSYESTFEIKDGNLHMTFQRDSTIWQIDETDAGRYFTAVVYQAGYPHTALSLLDEDINYDLDEVIQLVKSDCTPVTYSMYPHAFEEHALDALRAWRRLPTWSKTLYEETAKDQGFRPWLKQMDDVSQDTDGIWHLQRDNTIWFIERVGLPNLEDYVVNVRQRDWRAASDYFQIGQRVDTLNDALELVYHDVLPTPKRYKAGGLNAYGITFGTSGQYAQRTNSNCIVSLCDHPAADQPPAETDQPSEPDFKRVRRAVFRLAQIRNQNWSGLGDVPALMDTLMEVVHDESAIIESYHDWIVITGPFSKTPTSVRRDDGVTIDLRKVHKLSDVLDSDEDIPF
jgi:hypothetical protein